ncbi:hypothetical protein ROHU_015114 [Labeo rohita]|nr:hypothetical protein ROHU_015114 [Labeo rohita]
MKIRRSESTGAEQTAEKRRAGEAYAIRFIRQTLIFHQTNRHGIQKGKKLEATVRAAGNDLGSRFELTPADKSTSDPAEENPSRSPTTIHAARQCNARSIHKHPSPDHKICGKFPRRERVDEELKD